MVRGKEKITAFFEVTPEAKAEASLPSVGMLARKAYGMFAGTWVPSRFNISVNMPGDRKAVYNTFTSALVILKSNIWSQYISVGSRYCIQEGPVAEGIHFLYSKGFLVSNGIDEIEIIRQHFLVSRYREDILVLNVVPTLLCNLRCPYCFEGKAQIIGNRKKMSVETENAAISYIIRRAKGIREVRIVWFGGEPLLAARAIERMSAQLIPAFDRAKIRYTGLTSTNGTLLCRDVVDMLHKYKVSIIQVTVDVPKSAKQDARGRYSLDKVLDNISIAADKLKVHVRINLSKDDGTEFDQLYDGFIRRNLHKRVNSINIAKVFEPECSRSGCGSSCVSQQSYSEVVKRETLKGKDLGLPIMSYVPLTKVNYAGCAATCESSATIGPDGLLYKCVEDLGLTDRAYGSIFLKKPVKYENLLPWLEYDWFKYKMCRRCPVLPQCAGGCAHKRMFQSGTLKNEDFCYQQIRDDLENRVRLAAQETISKN